MIGSGCHFARHCERSEAIQGKAKSYWIASSPFGLLAMTDDCRPESIRRIPYHPSSVLRLPAKDRAAAVGMGAVEFLGDERLDGGAARVAFEPAGLRVEPAQRAQFLIAAEPGSA